jgi:hypothetical protein
MFLPRANPLKVIGRFAAILTKDGLGLVDELFTSSDHALNLT